MQKPFFLLFIIMLPLSLFAQVKNKEAFTTNLQQLGNGFPQEKIYIQFDKPAYAPGETIWYKAYIVSGTTPSLISANLYVDCADPAGKVLSHMVLPVLQSSAKSNFDIPATYGGSSIHIRAYTKWMLNFDSAFLFEKDIRIIQQKAAVKTIPAINKPIVDFFPESGDCIAGINSKIAFKAIYDNGRPFTVKGSVVNSKGEVVADLKTIHDGMGYFYLDAKINEKYTARWKDEQGKQYETALPAVKNTGISLEVKIAEGKRGFVIKRNAASAGNLQQVQLVATMDQQLVYMANVNLKESLVAGGAIPVSELPTGILQLTVFDSNWVAVAERITFINNNDYIFEPEVGFSTLGTSKHGKNVLIINVPDTLEANLSVAVTDAAIGIDSSDNIVSRLLLTGELKGNVYKPAYYFSDNSDSLQNQLDLVMLTNGWRRIKWDDLTAGKMPTIKYPNDTSYLTLAGKVFGISAADIRQSAILFLILDHKSDSTRNALQVTLDKDGNFSDPNVILFDTTRIYYQFVANKDMVNSTEVAFNNGTLPSPAKIYFDKSKSRYFLDSAAENRTLFFANAEARLAKLMEGNTLQGVTVTTKTKSREQVLDEKYTSGLFSGGQARQFDVENDVSAQGSMDVLNYLKGRVAGLNISGQTGPGSQASVSWRGGTPSFYLNEMNVDVTQLTSISMSDVAFIKVFNPPFFGAFGGGGSGAIAVYTKKGGPNTAAKGKGLPSKLVIGYAPEKQFYSPNYGTFDQRNEYEDLRSTLYWNPMVITTGKNRLVRLTFYNNDITNSFRVIVEGVTKDGRIAHIEKLIE
ncbi:hypothetical protein FRZ67_12830 [Panacibacter ginsenosidivorans]|uniref:TonB-dependent receptor plug domain-containing protein n=1 Tax=Panacibacter ginsenosidivorans TaxID=1813871 RepID=A0A5B8VB62_9BACT|nr:TonB-dependent receptor plug domain-containing protein [Panacibacter ginsenosidivorans]QEC68141.1 hypothetical protein FRZ67_12830 [Panacibacter ginsenosidivorans]